MGYKFFSDYFRFSFKSFAVWMYVISVSGNLVGVTIHMLCSCLKEVSRSLLPFEETKML
jgi:hypothetical protein